MVKGLDNQQSHHSRVVNGQMPINVVCGKANEETPSYFILHCGVAYEVWSSSLCFALIGWCLLIWPTLHNLGGSRACVGGGIFGETCSLGSVLDYLKGKNNNNNNKYRRVIVDFNRLKIVDCVVSF